MRQSGRGTSSSGCQEKMAADFLVTLCLPLNDLMALRSRRRGTSCLLRTLVRLAETTPGLVIERADDYVDIPFGALGLRRG